MVLFKVLSGSRAGAAQTAARFPVTVGRAPTAQLRLEDPGVWDQHLSLDLRFPEGFLLTLQPDANATVNGKPFKEILLRNGDLIEFGAVKLQFWIAKADQIRLAWREWLTWIALIVLTGAQIALIYWLPQ
jgi:pSer/pThr/pTyr-binding forkhead associated (FHA) protein